MSNDIVSISEVDAGLLLAGTEPNAFLAQEVAQTLAHASPTLADRLVNTPDAIVRVTVEIITN